MRTTSIIFLKFFLSFMNFVYRILLLQECDSFYIFCIRGIKYICAWFVILVLQSILVAENLFLYISIQVIFFFLSILIHWIIWIKKDEGLFRLVSTKKSWIYLSWFERFIVGYIVISYLTILMYFYCTIACPNFYHPRIIFRIISGLVLFYLYIDKSSMADRISSNNKANIVFFFFFILFSIDYFLKDSWSLFIETIMNLHDQ